MANLNKTNINGLLLKNDFLTVSEENLLLDHIDSSPWDTSLKRRVQHYGYRYNYKSKVIDNSLFEKLPDWLENLKKKIQKYFDLDYSFNQVIINEYEPGQGIASHIDSTASFDDIILSVSLHSACVMEFTKDDTKVPLLLKPRSILLLSGESRYEWKHGIKAVKKDHGINDEIILRQRRVSITFRKIIDK
ncbi:alpha-ketoglutarate-dependent dioxygenase AlkB [Flavobacterium sp.]|uniref:alpha-ketoglutarate-dependent dioxygenase AlkB n=1 Tax=Flavobacterium sp. TaxID=239 RepID=UPI0026243CC6|nr:alpha-ketoglutarate-dependent dioxygenase AlkB [Flavobacterium sp.]